MQAVPTLPMTVPTQEGVGWTWLGQPRRIAVILLRIRSAYRVYDSYTAHRSAVPHSFLVAVEAAER